MRRHSVVLFLPECLGFIFFDLFSNLIHTGCRRGRTPERPLRQPPRVWPYHKARPLLVGARSCHVNKLGTAGRGVTQRQPSGGKDHNLVSQSVALGRSFALRWVAARFRFVTNTRGSGTPGGRPRGIQCVTGIARPFAELRWTAPCRDCPGRSGGGGTSGFPHVRNEGVPGVKRSRRCDTHTA
jgi:hypothetical protein